MTTPWSHTTIAPPGTHHLADGAPAYTERFDGVGKYHAPGLAPVHRQAEAWHIDLRGQAAYPHRFTQTFGFYEGLAAVDTGAGWTHVDPAGRPVAVARHAWCGNLQGGRAPARDHQGGYVHLDRSGAPVYAQRWRYVGDYRDGLAVVQRDDGLHTHVDRGGALVHDQWFLDLDVFHKGCARAQDAGGWTHVDRSGHPLYSARFATVEPFYNRQARVKGLRGELLVIDEAGRPLVELRGPTPSSPASPTRAGLERTLALLEELPRDRPVSLIMRHAARSERDVLPGSDEPLTAAGEVTARALGSGLRGRITSIHTSPLLRCRATTEFLARGAQLDLSEGEGAIDDMRLGAPGVFVTDERLAGLTWAKHGHASILDYLCRGSASDLPEMPGIADPQLAASALLSHLVSFHGEELSRPGIGVFVTHDSILGPAIQRWMGAPSLPWPDFLDAAALWLADGAGVLVYAGHTARISVPPEPV